MFDFHGRYVSATKSLGIVGSLSFKEKFYKFWGNKTSGHSTSSINLIPAKNESLVALVLCFLDI